MAVKEVAKPRVIGESYVLLYPAGIGTERTEIVRVRRNVRMNIVDFMASCFRGMEVKWTIEQRGWRGIEINV